MKKSLLYAIWGLLFAVCAGLGFLPEPQGAVKALCTVLSAVFFVPPLILIHFGDRPTVTLVRNLAALALVVALVLLVLNILSASFSETAGTVLHYMLVIAASPLVCSQRWGLVLFLWAFVMLDGHQELKKK